MHIFLLILQVLGSAPHNFAQKPPAHKEGTGMLLVAACDPQGSVVVTPGYWTGVADGAGLARIPVPAQLPEDAPYQVNEEPVHGTVGEGQTLSAVCP
jgi:hypothetical protein